MKKKRKRREGGGKMQLLIPAAAGLEGVVKRQLLSLGYPKAPAENGRLALEGDWEDVARLNVFLRSGERVLIKLSEFPALTFDDLYDGIYALPWEEWLRVDSRILMDGKSVQRNRIKRLLREAFRSVREEIKGNYFIVLVPKVREDYSFFTFRKHLQCMIGKEKL